MTGSAASKGAPVQHDFEILTDSTCDIPLDELADLGVEMVPLHVFVGGGSYLDMIEITSEQFYDKMATADELPHSSQPEPAAFEAAYAKMARQGAHRILSLHIAGTLSGTVNSAQLAAQAQAPDVEVRVYDTRIATMAHGMMVKEAVRMRDAGETLEATVAHLDAYRAKLQLVFVPDTLENLVKNGRCSRATGLMSSLLNIKAIIAASDEDGSLMVPGKARGTQRALEQLVSIVEKRYGHAAKLVCTMLTVRNQAGVDELVEILKARGFDCDIVCTYSAGPVIATHTGPGLIGLACVPADQCYHKA